MNMMVYVGSGTSEAKNYGKVLIPPKLIFSVFMLEIFYSLEFLYHSLSNEDSCNNKNIQTHKKKKPSKKCPIFSSTI